MRGKYIFDSVTDAARVLLTAAVLSATAFSVFAWRLTRVDAHSPERLIGELRLAQWGVLLLAAIGATNIGFGVAASAEPAAGLEVALGVAFLVVAAFLLSRDPREALRVLTGAFVAHALVDIAHRPALLPPSLEPRWYAIGCAIFDVWIAAVCFWERRRR
jgi:hypothetical protein